MEESPMSDSWEGFTSIFLEWHKFPKSYTYKVYIHGIIYILFIKE